LSKTIILPGASMLLRLILISLVCVQANNFLASESIEYEKYMQQCMLLTGRTKFSVLLRYAEIRYAEFEIGKDFDQIVAVLKEVFDQNNYQDLKIKAAFNVGNIYYRACSLNVEYLKFAKYMFEFVSSQEVYEYDLREIKKRAEEFLALINTKLSKEKTVKY
jgi:hypothetical protein